MTRSLVEKYKLTIKKKVPLTNKNGIYRYEPIDHLTFQIKQLTIYSKNGRNLSDPLYLKKKNRKTTFLKQNRT